MSSHVRPTYLTAFFWHHLSRYLKDTPSWAWLNEWSFLAKLEHFSQGWHGHSFILIVSQTRGGNMDVLPSFVLPTVLHKWGFYERSGPSKSSSQECCSLDFWASVICGILIYFTVFIIVVVVVLHLVLWGRVLSSLNWTQLCRWGWPWTSDSSAFTS